ncbi:gamma-glutamylcyclotransferase family protein [Sphingomonas metalli]|uniref:gamma-glutamylcyclotransferase family protein n=1 Tax=Sphingomonas metalli TaxID=1779358 RepID=UPI00166ADF25|nr:gamma-glutamylcyclotransferase family protein [Sphingomonas metalli]
MEEVADQSLFSYGTLQDPSVQIATFGRLLTGQRDALAGWRIATVQIRDPDVLATSGMAEHLALVPDAEAPAVHGAVFLLTRAELAAADVYESEHYRREWIRLVSGRHAWVYVKA